MVQIHKVKAAVGTYLRAYGVLFLAVFVGAIYRAHLDIKNPGLWTHADFVILENGLWLGLLAVLARYINKNDTAYGRGSSRSTASAIVTEAQVVAHSAIPLGK